MKQVKVIAVVVTYNRLALLREAVAAIRSQSAPLAEIIIINNGCTDGTAEWLETQQRLTVVHQSNSGGAGGFHSGISLATGKGADYVWVMDDDTICNFTALEKMLQKISAVKTDIGFIGSRCNWTDGTPHLMNIPRIMPLFNNKIPFNKYDHHGLILAESSSFVSLLINAEAIKLVGLPYKEFFIWGDDQEFTRRITKSGYPGFYCADSIVLHKTPVNRFTDFYNDIAGNIWKHRYGFRNEFFMVKKNKGLLYFLAWLPAKLVYASVKILRIRKAEHFKFIRAVFGAGWESIFFNPAIDPAETLPVAQTAGTI